MENPAVGKTGAKSQYRGVYPCGRKWKAQIQFGGTQFYLGTFESEVDAAKAYDKKAREVKGDRSQTNFEEELEGASVSQNSKENTYCREYQEHEKIWNRTWQLSQRLVIARAARNKLEAMSSARFDEDKEALLKSLREEIMLLEIAKGDTEIALRTLLARDLLQDS